MKVKLSATILCCLLFCTVPLFAQPADSTIEVYPYNDHLVRFHYNVGFTFNVLALYGEDGILVVDTGFPFTGEQVVKAITGYRDSPIKYIAISHTHADHTGGLPAFPKDATIICSKEAVNSSYFDLPDRPTFPRDPFWFDGLRWIKFDNESIEFAALPVGHYKDEMTVQFVESNVVYIGSRMMVGSWPYVDPEFGDIDEIVKRIGRFAEAYPTATFALAHGPDQTAEQLLEYQALLHGSVEMVESELEKGRSITEIVSDSVLFEPYDTLNHGPITATHWVTAIARDRGKLDESATRAPIAKPLTGILQSEGIDATIAAYYSMKEAKPDGYNYAEAQLNRLGYELIYRNRYGEALKILELNAAVYDSSANVYDSIGEVQLLMGDTTAAIQSYERALEMNPEYQNSIQVLERIRK